MQNDPSSGAVDFVGITSQREAERREIELGAEELRE
jgi:hypothetical protein